MELEGLSQEHLVQYEGDIWARWKNVTYPTIYEGNYIVYGHGADTEPQSSLWMAYLSEGVGEHFQEGITVLDYGCGAARYANFLSGRLKEFTYYGVEPSNTQVGYWDSRNAIEVAREKLGHDPRVRLGHVGTELETEAIAKANVAVLGSVFTHIRIEQSLAILDKLSPILDRGVIVFTAILANAYQLHNAGAHGVHECYSLVHNTVDQYQDYFESKGIVGGVVCSIKLGSGYRQEIFRLSLDKSPG